MRSTCIVLMVIMVVYGDRDLHDADLKADANNKVDAGDNGLADTDLVMAFTVVRHGDRTPDDDEIEKFPGEHQQNKDIFFPYGTKALTNIGKQRAYKFGEYLRKRYNGLISSLYLPDEIYIRTTDYARTKMTALAAMAAVYPPPPAQRWNPFLNWQPVTYNTVPSVDDDLMYYYNCQRYQQLRLQVYETPEIMELMQPYEGLIGLIYTKTGTNITTPEDIFYLDNLFQTLNNVGVKTPTWAKEVMHEIKEVTKIEYLAQFYNSEMRRLSSGVLLAEIINSTNAAIAGQKEQAKLYLISAHENTVAALMSAIRVFKPHQPAYTSAISLELRKKRSTRKFGFTAVYLPSPGEKEVLLPIDGCGGQMFCDYDTFINLTQENVLPRHEHKKSCELRVS